MDYRNKIKTVFMNQRQVILLLGASVVHIFLGMGVSVVNTHYLDPENYGDVRYVENLIQFISGFLFLGYFVSGSRLLALEKEELKRRYIRGTLMVILSVIISILMILIYIYSVSMKLSGSMQMLFWFALPVCASPVLLSYIETTFQGDHHIFRISLARTVPSALYLLASYLIFSRWGATSARMFLLQQGIAVLVLGTIILSTKPLIKHFPVYFHKLQNENRTYGWPVYCGSIASVSLGQLAGVALGFFSSSGNSNVAFYTMALALASPLALLPNVIGIVYFKRFASVSRIPKRLCYGTVVITFIAWLVFSGLIKFVVAFLYPPEYSDVALYAIWLAMGMGIHGLGDMFNRFLGAHGLGRQIRNGAILCGAVMLLGNFTLVYFFALDGAIATRILGSLASMGSMLYYYLRFRVSAGEAEAQERRNTI